MIDRASMTDTLRIFGGVMLMTFRKGILIRRPTMEAAAERTGFDTGAVTTMQYLRRKMRPAPLLLALPATRSYCCPPARCGQGPDQLAQPFLTDTKETRAALNHFEPGNVRIADPKIGAPVAAGFAGHHRVSLRAEVSPATVADPHRSFTLSTGKRRLPGGRRPGRRRSIADGTSASAVFRQPATSLLVPEPC
jgi:hypothetical protein